MNIAILLSGGKGLRMGIGTPKQYIRVSGKMIITYCLETLLAHPLVDAVQIVAEEEWREHILADLKEGRDGTGRNIEKIYGFSAPGDNRQLSVFNALEDLKNSYFSRDGECKKNTVIVHDAVRPNLSKELLTSCLEVQKDHDGVMPVLPMKDTVYLSDGSMRIAELLDRKRVFAGQAPEVFDFDKYYEANLQLFPNGFCQINGSTEPAIMAGMDIAMIPGDENNYKITTKEDLERFGICCMEGEVSGGN